MSPAQKEKLRQSRLAPAKGVNKGVSLKGIMAGLKNGGLSATNTAKSKTFMLGGKNGL